MEIRYAHPDEGLHKTLRLLSGGGFDQTSRNGPVRRFPETVNLINTNPVNRVSMWDTRNANPIFHFMEALWMLGGMNEIKPMSYYNSGMANYSDDGATLRGTAYGYKWRHYFGYDQLELAIERLKTNPEDRRIVMTMWDPTEEWRNPDSKDISCNLQVLFGTRFDIEARSFILDMEVTNRSNDIVYGCLGSNVFHFTMLLEYVAFRTGFKVGNYTQVAFNLHGYLENPVFKACYEESKNNEFFRAPGPVTTSYMKVYPLNADVHAIAHFVRTGEHAEDPYLKNVGAPLFEAYRVFKLKSQGIDVPLEARLSMASTIAGECQDVALAMAAVEWFNRKSRIPAKAPPRITVVEAERPE